MPEGEKRMNLRYQLMSVGRFLYINGLLSLKRQTMMLVSISLAPFTFIYFLYLVSPRTELPFGVVGAIIFTTVFTGNAMLNDAAYYRIEHRIQELYVASPIRSFTYVAGLASSELAFTLPPLVVLFAILLTVIPVTPVQVLFMVLVVLLTWIMAASLGFMVSSFFKEFREIWPIASLLFNAISVIPPIFYPITVIPTGIRWIAYIAPTTYASQLGDNALGLLHNPPSAIYTNIVGLLLSTLVFVGVAAYFTRWREK